MLIGECPHCDNNWNYGWDEESNGYYCVLCKKCNKPFWIEFSRNGITRTHEQFLKDVSKDNVRKEKANNLMQNCIKDQNYIL